MKFDDDEYIAFCAELTKAATKYGVSRGTIISIIAEATRNREKAIEKTRVIELDGPGQMIYAPPSYNDEFIHVQEDIQMIYAPPTR